MLVPLVLALPSNEAIEAAVGPAPNGFAFGALVLLWSIAVAAQGPALTAVGQELAPPGAEATALALPRAIGDAAYIGAPLLLGLVADSTAQMGVECAVAGAASLAGALALACLGTW